MKIMKMIDHFKIKNNKGFSMVELLAVIVIFGIISTVGVVTVSKVVESSRDRYYESQKNALIMAAKAYVTDNRSALPKKVGQRKKIDLGTLKTKNYLKEDIKDRNKNKCEDDSYVSIFKINKTEYNYTAYLNCPACGGMCDTQSDDKPVINITLNMLNDYFDSMVAKIEMSGNEDKNKPLYSYQYKIYKNGSLVYTSKETRTSDSSKEEDITGEVKNHVPGIIKVVVVATNEDGISTTKTKSYNFKNTLNPICGNVHPNLNTKEVNGITVCDDAEWNKYEDYDFYIECNEVNGIKCKKHEFSSHFNSSDDFGEKYIEVEDVEGNKARCKIFTCMDKEPPVIKIDVYKRSSTGGREGNVLNSFTITSKDTTVHDLSYFNSSYPNGIYFEVAVSDNTVIKSYVANYNNANLFGSSASSTDLPNTTANSNNSIYKVSENFTHYFNDDGSRYLKLTALDGANNESSVILKADIDRVAPTCTNILKLGSSSGGNYTSGTWVNQYVYTSATCSDSGLGCKSGNGAPTLTTKGATTNVSNESNSYWTVQANGTSTTTYTVYDSANNSKTCATATEKVDRAAPTASISGSSDNYNLSGSISDTGGSGLKRFHWSAGSWINTSGNSQSFSKNGITDGLHYKVYVEDNAGNSGESDYIKAYKLCDKVKYDPSSFPSDSNYYSHDMAKAFKWISLTRSCTGSSPHIDIKFKEVGCKCKLDEKTSKSCGSGAEWHDYSNLTHGDTEMAHIYYANSDAGRAACSGSNYTLNSYVTKVCEKNIGTKTAFHGYYFYSGYAEADYRHFNPTSKWTHNGRNYNDRVGINDGGVAACQKACDSNY